MTGRPHGEVHGGQAPYPLALDDHRRSPDRLQGNAQVKHLAIRFNLSPTTSTLSTAEGHNMLKLTRIR
eukprot:9067717-Heterocapsa_arctica.AAC.1